MFLHILLELGVNIDIRKHTNTFSDVNPNCENVSGLNKTLEAHDT